MTLEVNDRRHGVSHRIDTRSADEAVLLKRKLLWREAGQPYDLRQLYVHVPFCFFHCSFCVYRGELVASKVQLERYVDDLLREMEALSPVVADLEFDTAFIGGGTVSVLPPPLLRRLLDGLNQGFRRTADQAHEFTVEMAPQGFTAEKLEIIRDAGANRVTLGVQSLDAELLRRMNRPPVALGDLEALLDSIARSGFLDLNVDLITGIPGRTWENLIFDFDFFARSACDSVMVYVEMGEYRATPRTDAAHTALELVQRLRDAQSGQFVLNSGQGPNEYNRFRRIGRPPLAVRYSTASNDPTILTVGLGPGARSFTQTLSFVAT